MPSADDAVKKEKRKAGEKWAGYAARMTPEKRAERNARNVVWYRENRARGTENAAKWRARNPDKHNGAQAKWKSSGGKLKYALRKYRLTPAQYEEMLSRQGGLCDICRGIPRAGSRLCVDHAHDETGRVRALLCHRCNLGIGNLMDDPALLRAAANYLERHAPAAAIPQTFS